MRELIRNLADDLDVLCRSEQGLSDIDRALLRRLSKDANKVDDVAEELARVKSDCEFYKRRTEELTYLVQDQERRIAALMASDEALQVLERAADAVSKPTTDAIRAQGRLQEMLTMLASKQMINAIKIARAASGLGLKEAKDYCEAIRNCNPPPVEVVRKGEPAVAPMQGADDIPF